MTPEERGFYDELAYWDDEHFKALERTILPNPPKFVIYQTPYKQPDWLWKYFPKTDESR